MAWKNLYDDNILCVKQQIDVTLFTINTSATSENGQEKISGRCWININKWKQGCRGDSPWEKGTCRRW